MAGVNETGHNIRDNAGADLNPNRRHAASSSSGGPTIISSAFIDPSTAHCKRKSLIKNNISSVIHTEYSLLLEKQGWRTSCLGQVYPIVFAAILWFAVDQSEPASMRPITEQTCMVARHCSIWDSCHCWLHLGIGIHLLAWLEFHLFPNIMNNSINWRRTKFLFSRRELTCPTCPVRSPPNNQ